MEDSNDADPLTDSIHEAKTCCGLDTHRLTFLVMCMCFGLNHASVTTPIGFASTLLGHIGNLTNAVLYGVCLVTAMLLGPLFTSSLGPRNALVLGMICYTIYVALFTVALQFSFCSNEALSVDKCEKPDTVQVQAGGIAACMIGAAIGGIGAGSLWTAQGAFFGAICEAIADSTGAPLQAVTAQLASQFAMWYLGQECFWKVIYTIMVKYIGWSPTVAFIIFTVLAALATVGMAFGKDARPKGGIASQPVFAKAAAAFSLWSDPHLWLLCGLNITFGFSAAYLSGYINANWQKEAIHGSGFIGFLGAIIAAIAALMSWFGGWAATRLGTKMPIVAFGCLCFLVIGILSFIQAPYEDGISLGPGGWGWGIVVFYILQGLGRGVYESTNKGLFADAFQGSKATGAFANCMMQSTLSSTIGYILGSVSLDKYDVYPLLVFSVITVPMLLVSLKMRQAVKTEVQG